MTDIWSFQADGTTGDRDVVGYDVVATDGTIGTVDPSTTDAAPNGLVVDTGFWIFGTTHTIPVAAIARIDHAARTVFVELTTDQIKDDAATGDEVADR